MAVEAQIVALLRANAPVAAIVGTRIYAMPAKQGASSPFLTYQVTSATRSGLNYAGDSVHDVTGLQVDCWADDATTTSAESRYDQITELARAVRAALDGQGLQGDDNVDLIRWDGWTDFNTPAETRRSLDFTLLVRGM